MYPVAVDETFNNFKTMKNDINPETFATSGINKNHKDTVRNSIRIT